MNVAEAAEHLRGRLAAAAAQAAAREVRGGYASDLLSDVIANSNEGDLWITMQRHVNTIAVAQLRGLAGIVLVNGREPEPEAAARAEAESIPIISTELSAFDAVGTLFALGVRGRRQA